MIFRFIIYLLNENFWGNKDREFGSLICIYVFFIYIKFENLYLSDSDFFKRIIFYINLGIIRCFKKF